jgi:hypothetical protein
VVQTRVCLIAHAVCWAVRSWARPGRRTGRMPQRRPILYPRIPGCRGPFREQSHEHRAFRSRPVADASGAPVLRDQGPDRPAGHGKADPSLDHLHAVQGPHRAACCDDPWTTLSDAGGSAAQWTEDLPGPVPDPLPSPPIDHGRYRVGLLLLCCSPLHLGHQLLEGRPSTPSERILTMDRTLSAVLSGVSAAPATPLVPKLWGHLS